MDKRKEPSHSELWEMIYSIVSLIPRKEVKDDAVDAISATTSIEEMIKPFLLKGQHLQPTSGHAIPLKEMNDDDEPEYNQVDKILHGLCEFAAKEIKICTGCGHLSTEKIKPPALGCCPDNHYLPIKKYWRLSTFPAVNEDYISPVTERKLKNIFYGSFRFLSYEEAEEKAIKAIKELLAKSGNETLPK